MGPHEVTGRDAARDELVQQFRAIRFKNRYDRFDAVEMADAVLMWMQRSGYRRSVTAEQIEAGARAVQRAEAVTDWNIDAAHYECGNNKRPPTLETWDSLPPEERNTYLANSRIDARAFGLEVTE